MAAVEGIGGKGLDPVPDLLADVVPELVFPHPFNELFFLS